MSSAILYLAIVAIWAVVLVPRWLRPRASRPAPVRAESADAGRRAPAGPGQDAGADLVAGMTRPGTDGEPMGGETVTDTGVRGEASRDEVVTEAAPEAEVAAPPPPLRRSEVLKARRRILSTLIALTVIAFGLVVTRVDAYWIVIPPAVLLAGYMMLLRQFAHIDAERDRRAARIRNAEARAQDATAPGESPPATAPVAGEPEIGSDAPAAPDGAEIIDISGRIGDQVYDQYADVAHRAVGD